MVVSSWRGVIRVVGAGRSVGEVLYDRPGVAEGGDYSRSPTVWKYTPCGKLRLFYFQPILSLREDHLRSPETLSVSQDPKSESPLVQLSTRGHDKLVEPPWFSEDDAGEGRRRTWPKEWSQYGTYSSILFFLYSSSSKDKAGVESAQGRSLYPGGISKLLIPFDTEILVLVIFFHSCFKM